MLNKEAAVMSAMLKALAHPVRVLIVDALRSRERCVCDLNRLADIDQSCVSRHLAILVRAGIVSGSRKGMKVFYRLEMPCIVRTFDCIAEAAGE